MFRILPALLVLIAVACAPAAPTAGNVPPPPAPPDRMVFMAGYKPQANMPFVAAYVAKDRGYFREQNLEVEIQHSAGQGEHVRLLTAGVVQVTTAAGMNVITLAAESGLPLVAFAVFGQRSDQAFAVRAESPIRTAKDFEGKVVGYKGMPSAEYLAMIRAAGVDRSKIQEVNVGFDPRILLTGRVDVLPVFRSNEPYVLRSLGQEVRLITPEEYGVPTIGLTYIATRDSVERQRSLLVRFMRATLAATEWIRQNPDAALDIVMRYAPGEDRAHQAAMLRVEIESLEGPMVEKNGLLAVSAEQWRDIAALAYQLGVISKPIDIDRHIDDSIRREALGRK
ncbi:MAG: ABC transporter substrate-binding protein [Chloroflexota bacterium]|nr:ABC transporter substrate-binding protein [Dehalococcoidia bacterium]MDW8254416.1 ABC transporter substrate-binding protein [Chloroflexota bacterium]